MWMRRFVHLYIAFKLHGSKVSRESDLRSVSYNRSVGVRSFVKNVTSLREYKHNSWTVQDCLMEKLVKICVVGKKENLLF